jgi:uncharacterized membrane protein YeaQ/YmgE (transglycosylase-associated protein family)
MPRKIEQKPWLSQYIYSLYWAITTIVTVGYGDITPQNEYEILVTIVIEVIGAAVFGYIINTIGMTMAELKYLCIL